jgi:hypothetical protein
MPSELGVEFDRKDETAGSGDLTGQAAAARSHFDDEIGEADVEGSSELSS